MGKVTNFSGQPVYNQLLNLLDKQKICEISHKTLKSESYHSLFFLLDLSRFFFLMFRIFCNLLGTCGFLLSLESMNVAPFLVTLLVGITSVS